jgi:mono/diheme cytochrome c family protein
VSEQGYVTTGLRIVFRAARLVLAGLCVGYLGLGYLAPPAGAAPPPPSPHSEAVAALADLRAAIVEITKASHITATDPAPYQEAAKRAITELGGATEKESGAIGHLDWLLHRPKDRPWTPAVQGAWANVTIAVGELQRAMIAHGFSAYDTDITMALDDLEVALGRATGADVLGGLTGAIATTELGVPDGATVVSGCQTPRHAPAYGVTGGHLLFVAVPNHPGDVTLPGDYGIGSITVAHDVLVAHTAAAAMAAHLCGRGKRAALQPPAAAAAPGTRVAATAAASADLPKGAAAGRAPPKLYTEAQAEAGKLLFQRLCTTCHGDHLEGKSAPPNGGRIFLSKAAKLGWSVSDMRLLVVSSMPLNNPASLSPKQYAKVLAFLLATDCYPAGKVPFPTEDTALLKATPLRAVASVRPDNPKLGTCHVG